MRALRCQSDTLNSFVLNTHLAGMVLPTHSNGVPVKKLSPLSPKPPPPEFLLPKPPPPAFLPSAQPSLPPEFLAIQGLTSHCSDLDLDEKTTLRVTIFSCAQVCQQWRLAARDCRILWPNAVDFQWQLPEVIADLLPLSRPHPIDVGHRAAPFRIAKQRDVAVLNLLKVESRRIREWNVEFPLAHQLHSMSGWVFPSTDQPLVSVLRYAGEFMSSLWDLQALSLTLRKLSIRDVSTIQPIQDAAFFGALTELHISNVSTVSRPSQTEWLSILQNMPHVKLLALRNAARVDLNAPPLFDVWLPQLRLLSLQSDEWLAAFGQIKLLQHLQVPEICGRELGLPSTSIFKGRSRDVQRIMDHVGGMVAATTLTIADTPQIEIGVRPTTNGFQHPDLTLNWNGEQGSAPLIEYLDAHAASRPKFPPLNIMFNNAAIADVDHVFELTCDIFWMASYVRVHLEVEPSSHPSVRHVASALPSLLSRMPQIEVLKLDQGSSAVLKQLYLLVPSPTVAPTQKKPGIGGLFSRLNLPVLPNLNRIILDIGSNDASSTDMVLEGGIKDDDDGFVVQENYGFPIEVVRR
ncbi:hypothetical protein FA13DRAFT_1735301 [Coprinellus micaceus]|uniref:F-box domain-containing protein n=1 Tax=Coprinellus micaceus TaxID=71717 RepID=A0A4Y7T3N3_COPMI|nr:hypothetical protein FA13DRAFT_1735301 [Coprinellus micaceus]